MVKEKIEDITMNGLNSIPDSNLITHLESKGYTVTKPLTLEEILNQLREEIKDKGSFRCEDKNIVILYNQHHEFYKIQRVEHMIVNSLSPVYFTRAESRIIMDKYNQLLIENGFMEG